MDRSGKEFWVGLFVLAGIVVLCGLIIQFGKFRERFQPMYQFQVRFQNVGQIARGAPVITSGVNVGKVTDITLERDQGTVLLTLSVWEGVIIRKDARFTIKQAGLLGDLNVVVIPVSDSAPPLRPGDVVEGVAPTDIQDTLEQAGEVVVKIKAAAEHIESATRKLDRQVLNEQTLGDVRQAVSNVNSAAAQADRLLGEVRQLVDKTAAGVDGTLANLNQFSTNLARASAQVLHVVTVNEDDIRTVVENLRDSTEKLDGILSDLREGRGTAGKLLVDETLHQELKRLVTNLRRFGVLRYKDAPLPATTNIPPSAPASAVRSRP